MPGRPEIRATDDSPESSALDKIRIMSGRYRWPPAPVLLLSPALALLSLFLAATVVLLVYSTFEFAQGTLRETVTFQAYVRVLTDPFYWKLTVDTLSLGLVVTLASLVVGYPTAFAMARIRRRTVFIFVAAVIFSPLLFSVIVRAYGWLLLLSSNGVVNYVLTSLGVINEPLRLINNFTGVAISMVHILLPFMTFSILTVMLRMDPSLNEAAADLGAGPMRTFLKVTLPLTVPGIVAGVQLVFALAVSSYVSPTLLGGGRVTVLASQVYENLISINWPLAAVLSFALLTVALGSLALLNALLIRYLRVMV